jgi:hypothetical protein
MMKYIEQLREKPEEHKKRYAFVATTAITSIIFAGWLATLPFALDEAPPVANTVSPLDNAGGNLGAAYESLRTQFGIKTEEGTEAPGTADVSPELSSDQMYSGSTEPDTTGENSIDNFYFDTPQESTDAN